MLPLRQKKVDMSAMTEEEKKLFRLYGKLPSHKNVLSKVQRDRKFFDSGDYAMSKAGLSPQLSVGTAIPSPENIPHAAVSPPSPHTSLSTPGTGGKSPVRDIDSAEPTDATAAAAPVEAESETKQAAHP
ncbi:hypothetical protein BOTBODRAFT_178621 [Botryobasidium botryosum FD-172 SS1]|uniref:mRNA stability protein n=1 Tax=Botryobasidium botryosum (strain FD-172 SS1) TaxID=930990 RepID=A0A067M2A6_BOTB1|nr:hypothetical protein BOTBODRAFT_178621 [Botryobasidium botryosum FD-172 SS1]